jgi:thiamine-phosphate pyrophosphorylase
VATRVALPRLYVILDAAVLTVPAQECALELAEAGVGLMQYRNKVASARELLNTSQQLSSLLIPRGVCLVVNDRPDIAVLAGATGVHVGQEDLEVEQARELVSAEKWVGVSTHNIEQFRRAARTSADYVAVGPIFATGSKANPDPVVGTDLLRRVRRFTEKPIVAIGGITVETAASVIEAGADCVAVISDILRAPDRARRTRQYLELLGRANRGAAV